MIRPKKPKRSHPRRQSVVHKVGARVCDLSSGGWGTVLEVRDKAKSLNLKLPSSRLLVKHMRFRYVYKIAWDMGTTADFYESSVRSLWIEGDDPGLGRAVLVDPKAKE